MLKSRKPLRCTFGFHSWYLDSGLFFSVNRCNDCPAVDNKERAKLLDRERKLWEEEKQDSFFDTAGRVAEKLFPLQNGQ